MRRIRLAHLLPLSLLAAIVGAICASCRIEPPLHLPEDRPEPNFTLAEVITDIDVIWNLEGDWRKTFWYGWDQEDINRWGTLDYPEPHSFEARFYAFGEIPGTTQWSYWDKLTLFERSFRRRFDYGYHDMLIWSHVETPDGIQSLIVNENDPDNIFATTSRTRLGYAAPSRTDVFHHPEIFYAGGLEKFFISRDTLDYDYFDAGRNAWVKKLKTTLYPLVYTYLVQVVIYNNNGRIVGLTDYASINSLSDAVHLHTGHTSNNPIVVAYEMRLKKDIPAREGRHADIFGGKMTTFGLCDMEPWSRSRAGTRYEGSRGDLKNHMMLAFSFANHTDSAYSFDVTDQMQRQAHGGVITIEIDADTLHTPHTRGQGASGFDPVIVPPDSITHEFEM